jgi:hypothetical protein
VAFCAVYHYIDLPIPSYCPQGSTFERTAGPPDPMDTKTVWKDLDLDLAVGLPREVHER